MEQVRISPLSVGTYRILAGGTDDQQPHTEEEMYVVRAGWARLVAGGPVGPGSVVFVPAGEAHRFVDVTEELAVLVVFVPAESAG